MACLLLIPLRGQEKGLKQAEIRRWGARRHYPRPENEAAEFLFQPKPKTPTVMNWRVIVRFSFERDAGSRLRNQIAAALNSCGIQNTNTGSWESAAANPTQAANQLSEVLQALAVVSEQPDAQSVDLDHIWVYIDRVD